MSEARKLRTGMPEIDRQLGGGLPAGGITVLEAPPGSQAYLLLQELTSSRGTIWISFARPEAHIQHSLEESPATSGECTIKHIKTNRVNTVKKLLTAVPDRSNIILDPIEILEESLTSDEYREFLGHLQDHLIERESIAVLYGNREDSVPDGRVTSKYFADVVLEITKRPSGENIEYFLQVPKYRRGECPSSVIKLDLNTRVDVDTSRDIA